MCENSCYGFSEFFSVSDLPPILQREGRDGVRGGRLGGRLSSSGTSFV